MAGPYTGAWRNAAVSEAQYTGISKWGTGVNPIHSIPGMGPYISGNSKINAPPVTTPGGEETDLIVDEDMSWQVIDTNPDPDQPYYNTNDSALWGANSQTGIADRPEFTDVQSDRYTNEMGWGLPNPPYDPSIVPNDPRTVTQNSTHDAFPSWGGSRKPKPAGSFLRSLRRGANLIVGARVLPLEDVAQGWQNKAHGIAADAVPSDPSQYEMQTSMTQRYKIRAGSQRSASQSTFDAPIESRVTGQKLKVYAREDSARHWDMTPYQQEDYVRPFLSRQAGTGYREWNLPNEMYQSPVIQREPAPDPQLGPIAGNYDNVEPAYDFGVGYA